MSERLIRNLLLLLLLLVVVITFSPVLSAHFVNWDDPDYVYENQALLNFDWGNLIPSLKAIFSQRLTGIYTPVTTLSFAIEKAIYGVDKPSLLHFSNLMMHLIVVLMTYVLSRRLGLSLYAALVIAALMGLHPMRVESVAWITERKDVLYGILFFSLLIYYVKIRDEKPAYKSLVIWLLFICILMTKVLAVTIPVVFILIDYYYDRHLRIRRLYQHIPLVLFSFLYGIMGYIIASDENYAEIPNSITGWISNLSYSCYAFMQYLIKYVYPYEMLPVYPYPLHPSWYHYTSISIPLLVLIILAYCFFKGYKIVFFGLSFFVVNVVFTLQIIPIGQAFMADRFTYIAYFGMFFILVNYLEFWAQKRNSNKVYFSVIPVIIVYMTMTYQQSKIWYNSETLWTHQLKHKPTTESGLLNIANYYKDVGQGEQHKYHLELLAQHHPDNESAYNELGMIYAKSLNQNDQLKAINYYTQAIEADSNYAGVFTNRGVMYGRLGNYANALRDLDRSLAIDAAFVDAHLNKAVILNSKGDYAEAIVSLDNYLNYRERDADKWIIKGQIHQRLNQYNEAIASINKGIMLSPNNGLYVFERGVCYYYLGELEKAKSDISNSRFLGYKGREELSSLILTE